MPTFLHGTFTAVARKTRKEGRRCGDQYLQNGTFPYPREMLEVPAGEVVIAHEAVDFLRERPAWRLYMATGVATGLYETLDWQNTFQVGDAFEEFCRETAWGALHFAVAQTAPHSAQRTALRLRAVLRFWEQLQSVRYLFTSPQAALTLEEVMTAARGWAMDAWCPVGDASVRERLEQAAERMARATREDCLEAILRQLPRAFAAARDLKHRNLLTDPALLRRRFASLEPATFERVSGAATPELLGQLYAWDQQLGKQ
ncbi:hypothetical protein [Hyalangium sp.]|uniref:hypothetical protein n=1 Tax=Hyalangium sp. TaxID=2028555 RepID=UPI00389A52F8